MFKIDFLLHLLISLLILPSMSFAQLSIENIQKNEEAAKPYYDYRKARWPSLNDINSDLSKYIRSNTPQQIKEAIHENNYIKFNELLEPLSFDKIEVTFNNYDYYSPAKLTLLHYAIMAEKSERDKYDPRIAFKICEYLSDDYVNFDLGSRTPLMEVLRNKERDQKFIFNFIEKCKINPMLPSANNKTPLMAAAKRGDWTLFNYFIDMGADPKATDFEGVPVFLYYYLSRPLDEDGSSKDVATHTLFMNYYKNLNIKPKDYFQNCQPFIDISSVKTPVAYNFSQKDFNPDGTKSSKQIITEMDAYGNELLEDTRAKMLKDPVFKNRFNSKDDLLKKRLLAQCNSYGYDNCEVLDHKQQTQLKKEIRKTGTDKSYSISFSVHFTQEVLGSYNNQMNCNK